MNLEHELICPDADETFELFFRAFGYVVSWEGKRATGERWYEFRDASGLAFQISMPPPPIAELIADLPHFIEGSKGIGPTDYWCACANDDKLRELLERVRVRLAEDAS